MLRATVGLICRTSLLRARTEIIFAIARNEKSCWINYSFLWAKNGMWQAQSNQLSC